MEQTKMVYCPRCGYELPSEVVREQRRCTHCGWVFHIPYFSADTFSGDEPILDTLVQKDNSTIQVKSPILAEASELIHGDRAKDYGDAKESFAHIAALWSSYTKTTISPQDVAMMMSLLKMSRAKHSGFTHRDSFVDMAGYVALASDISE